MERPDRPEFTLQFGFLAARTGANTVPGTFTLNGLTCTGGAAPTGTATSTGTGTAPPSPAPTPPDTTTPTRTATGTGTGTAEPTGTVTATGTAVPPGTPLGSGRIQYGPTYTGEGTFYGATGEGNCSYEASDDRMIAAMNHADYENSQACGAHLAVSGPSGVTITVKVVDQCPECSPGDIDLSAEAFAKLADPSAGRIPISWTLLSPDLDTPVSYRYKEGSSQWWCGIQVRDHRNPVRSVEVQVGSSWRNLPRKD
ncbi:MAG: expansin EXLX1 family cellulose-binding protein, partial [Kineosporiaceae bacterium]